jgi:hypothetical protein
VVPSQREKRIAVSALIPRFPRMSSFNRFVETRSRSDLADPHRAKKFFEQHLAQMGRAPPRRQATEISGRP